MATIKDELRLLRELLCFKETGKTGKINETAGKHGYKQSNFSNMLKQLEEELNLPLLTRLSTGVVLTSDGREIFEIASQIENILQRVRTYSKRSKAHGNLRLWVGDGLASGYISGCLPEFYLGADYRSKGFTAGAGIHFISLKPRTHTTVVDETGTQQRFKVNERMTTFSCEAHLEYKSIQWRFAAKTILASCLDHTALLGGYGISNIDPVTGEQEYTPMRHSTSWMNFTYGKKWKAHFFAGYTKKLGCNSPLVSSEQYGLGLNIDQICSFNLAFSYNLPHWQIGLEYVPTTAWYGDTDFSNGRVINTHNVTNHRILGLMMYYF